MKTKLVISTDHMNIYRKFAKIFKKNFSEFLSMLYFSFQISCCGFWRRYHEWHFDVRGHWSQSWCQWRTCHGAFPGPRPSCGRWCMMSRVHAYVFYFVFFCAGFSRPLYYTSFGETDNQFIDACTRQVYLVTTSCVSSVFFLNYVL